MAQTSFDVDANAAKALETLKEVYGVSSNAAALKRALAIAALAAEYADKNGRVQIVDTNNPGLVVVIPQRI